MNILEVLKKVLSTESKLFCVKFGTFSFVKAYLTHSKGMALKSFSLQLVELRWISLGLKTSELDFSDGRNVYRPVNSIVKPIALVANAQCSGLLMQL